MKYEKKLFIKITFLQTKQLKKKGIKKNRRQQLRAIDFAYNIMNKDIIKSIFLFVKMDEIYTHLKIFISL